MTLQSYASEYEGYMGNYGNHPALAATLLEPFDVEMVTPGHATVLVALVEQYGEQWTAALLAEWSGSQRWRPRGRGDRCT